MGGWKTKFIVNPGPGILSRSRSGPERDLVHILCQLHIYYLRFILKKRSTPLFEQLINCKFLCLSEIIS